MIGHIDINDSGYGFFDASHFTIIIFDVKI
jgi:hypothetical protein